MDVVEDRGNGGAIVKMEGVGKKRGKNHGGTKENYHDEVLGHQAFWTVGSD